jgi:hypothetical protein
LKVVEDFMSSTQMKYILWILNSWVQFLECPDSIFVHGIGIKVIFRITPVGILLGTSP